MNTEELAQRLDEIHQDWVERRDVGEWTMLDGRGDQLKEAAARLRSLSEQNRALEHRLESAIRARNIWTGDEVTTRVAEARDAAVREIERLSEQNRVLRRALKQLAENELDEHNCASVELAGKRVRTIARRALEEAE